MSRSAVILAAAALSLLTAAPAAAQAYRAPTSPNSAVLHGYPFDPRYAAERQRLEMERLRLRAESNALDAERARLRSQLAIQDLSSRRQPPLTASAAIRPLGSVAGERARREEVQGRTGEIDAWLDRRAD